jgi:hypothetical protein
MLCHVAGPDGANLVVTRPKRNMKSAIGAGPATGQFVNSRRYSRILGTSNHAHNFPHTLTFASVHDFKNERAKDLIAGI